MDLTFNGKLTKANSVTYRFLGTLSETVLRTGFHDVNIFAIGPYLQENLKSLVKFYVDDFMGAPLNF